MSLYFYQTKRRRMPEDYSLHGSYDYEDNSLFLVCIFTTPVVALNIFVLSTQRLESVFRKKKLIKIT